MNAYSAACRACALGLLRTAREWKSMNRPDQVARLVNEARWYWQRYLEGETS